MFVIFTIMIVLAIGSFTLIAYYLLIPKRDMPHNKCHTDKLKIDVLINPFPNNILRLAY